MRKKKKFFSRKQLGNFRALDNSDLQIKRLLQNKTTDYNNYTYTKTILSTQIYVFVRMILFFFWRTPLFGVTNP